MYGANVWLNVLWVFLGCLLLTLSVWSICSLMEVARAKCRAPSCCLRHPRWHALCPSPCLTLKSSARPLTADSAHPHLRVSHSHLPLPTTNPHYHPSHPDLGQCELIFYSILVRWELKYAQFQTTILNLVRPQQT